MSEFKHSGCFKDARWRALLAFGALLLSLPSWASDRVALVIGNAGYKTAPLLNPANDAKAMAKLLRDAGFTVDEQQDASKAQLDKAVANFGAAIKDPKVKFGLFYFAGHGVQQDWRNYLIPVNANIRTGADVPGQTTDVSELLRYMDQAKGRNFLVILDACRDDPFAGTYKPSAKGLSQFEAPTNSLLAYATAPGSVAIDGIGKEAHGLYTGNLLRELSVRGAKLEDAFKRVRLNVRMASEGRQVPWESTSLEEDVYLFPTVQKKLTDAETDQLHDQEMMAWLRVRGSKDPRQIADFIREFPSGAVSELAQSRLTRILALQARREDLERERIAAEKAAIEREEQAKRVLAQQASDRAETERREAERAAALAAAQAAQIAAQVAAQEAAARAAAESALAQRQREEAAALARAEATKREAERAAAANAQAARVAAEREQAALAQREADLVAQRMAQADKERNARLDAERKARELAAAQAERVATAQLNAARLAREQAATPLAAAAPQVVQATPFFKGSSEYQRFFTVGDVYDYKVIDLFNRSEKPLTLAVTKLSADDDRVEFNNGEYASDLMGNITRNLRGTLSEPRQFYPADLLVGKRWKSRFKQTRADGTVYTFDYKLKVVGREKVTVPAGTFDAFKIEARGFNIQLNASIERNIWVVPGLGADVAHETTVRLSNGRFDQRDRQELVRIQQAFNPSIKALASQ